MGGTTNIALPAPTHSLPVPPGVSVFRQLLFSTPLLPQRAQRAQRGMDGVMFGVVFILPSHP